MTNVVMSASIAGLSRGGALVLFVHHVAMSFVSARQFGILLVCVRHVRTLFSLCSFVVDVVDFCSPNVDGIRLCFLKY